MVHGPGPLPGLLVFLLALHLVSFTVLLDFVYVLVGFHKWWIPKNGLFVMEPPIKIDDLGVPPFQETSIFMLGIFSVG